jgi:hypothetical protein
MRIYDSFGRIRPVIKTGAIISLLISTAIGGGLSLSNHFQNAEIDASDYSNIRTDVQEQPALKPFVLDALKDLKITVREKDTIDEASERLSREETARNMRDEIEGKTNAKVE